MLEERIRLRARTVLPGDTDAGPFGDTNRSNNLSVDSIEGRTPPDYEVTIERPAPSTVVTAGDSLRVDFRIANVGGSQPATNHSWVVALEQTGGSTSVLEYSRFQALLRAPLQMFT